MRDAFRSLVRRPGFSLLAILTLAVGLGVNAVVFSAVNALLLEPGDLPHLGRTGWILSQQRGNPYGNATLADFQALARTGAFELVAAEGRLPVSVRVDGGAREHWAMVVSADYFPLLGEAAESGRVFTAADVAHVEPPVLVSRRFLDTRLGGGPIAGRSLVVNGRSYAVAGVIRDGFQGPGGLYEPDMWLPLERLDLLQGPPSPESATRAWLTVVARTGPGVDAGQVRARLAALSAQLAGAFPATHTGRQFQWYPMQDGHPQLRGIAPFAWMALAGVGIVLVVACVNVAGLFLARAVERRPEMAVRAALGASRRRLVQQVLLESALLAAAGGAAALVVAAWSADLLAAFSLPAPIPQRLHLTLDGRVAAFTAAMVALAALLTEIAPALQSSRTDLVTSIRLTGSVVRHRSATRALIAGAQIAAATVFVACALVFVRSFANLAWFDPGFDARGTLVLELTPSTYGYDAARARDLAERLQARVAALPGVQHAALADRVPFYIGFNRRTALAPEDAPCDGEGCRQATVYAVGPGHFAALGIPFRAGRDFAAAEPDTAIIVDERTAATLWPGQPALGRRVRLGDGPPLEVAGIVATITHRNPAEEPGLHVYRRLRTADFGGTFSLVVRSSGEPRTLLGPLQELAPALDPALPARAARLMTERMEVPLWPARTLAGFFLVCGTLALVLAAVGLFGLTHHAVAQRTREFGVRAALGATRQRVFAEVLGDGLRRGAPAVALGLLLALVATRLLARLLFGIAPADPPTFAAAALLQFAVIALACAAPAWRATRVDPVVALRHD